MDVKVKICGLTDPADVRAALEAGADLLGFIFFPKSPRYVTPERVRYILEAAGPERAGVLTVGVFVNESPGSVAQILDFCRLDVAQLHGEEPPAALGLADDPSVPKSGRQAGVQEDRSPLCGRAYKALRPGSMEEAKTGAVRYALLPHLRSVGRLPAFLLDAYHPVLRGGTGSTGDWQIASALAGQYPILLAGGLNPANVAPALQAVPAWGVDVASGVEEAPGKKDHAAMRAFVTAVRRVMDEQRKRDG